MPGEEDVERLERLREKIKFMIGQWKEEKIVTTSIEEALKSEQSYADLKRFFKNFKRDVTALKDLETDLLMLDTSGFEEKVAELKGMAKDPARVDDLRNGVTELEETIIKRDQGAEAKKEEPHKKVHRRIVKKVVKKEKEPEEDAEDLEWAEQRPSERKPKGPLELYLRLVQEIIEANKRVVTLQTLRMAQRTLKKGHPKAMFFSITSDFKLDSVLPEHPDSYEALRVFLETLLEYLIQLVGEEKANEMMTKPANAFIVKHKPDFRASTISDYLPSFVVELL